MQPFGSSEACLKCGGTEIGARWCHWWLCATGVRKEHVHRNCTRCGYGWLEVPLDAAALAEEAGA